MAAPLSSSECKKVPFWRGIWSRGKKRDIISPFGRRRPRKKRKELNFGAIAFENNFAFFVVAREKLFASSSFRNSTKVLTEYRLFLCFFSHDWRIPPLSPPAKRHPRERGGRGGGGGGKRGAFKGGGHQKESQNGGGGGFLHNKKMIEEKHKCGKSGFLLRLSLKMPWKGTVLHYFPEPNKLVLRRRRRRASPPPFLRGFQTGRQHETGRAMPPPFAMRHRVYFKHTEKKERKRGKQMRFHFRVCGGREEVSPKEGRPF